MPGRNISIALAVQSYSLTKGCPNAQVLLLN